MLEKEEKEEKERESSDLRGNKGIKGKTPRFKKINFSLFQNKS